MPTLLLAFSAFAAADACAANYTAVASGPWNNVATWEPQSIPGDLDAVTVPKGISVSIPAGYTVTVGSSGSINNAGGITNAGTIEVLTSGANAIGINIWGSGTMTNSGSITVSNSGASSSGIYIIGSMTNAGSIVVSNSGASSNGIEISSNGGSKFQNASGGSITLSNSQFQSSGIINSGYFSNMTGGTVQISNTVSSLGFSNFGGFANSGTITMSSDSSSTSIDNETGTIDNAGTMTLSNCPSGCGFVIQHNGGTVTNNGAIDISSSGDFSYGITIAVLNGIPTITDNFGTIRIKSTGGTGILIEGGTNTNHKTGTIKVESTGGIGLMLNAGGNGLPIGAITNNSGGTIDISNTGGTGINNAGMIYNNGTMVGQCGATYCGLPPAGNGIQGKCTLTCS